MGAFKISLFIFATRRSMVCGGKARKAMIAAWKLANSPFAAAFCPATRLTSDRFSGTFLLGV